MTNSEQVWPLVEAKKDYFIALSDRVWGTPELLYAEFRSVSEHIAALDHESFRLTRDVSGLPTAVMGEAGSGGPVVAILGEFDALAGLSQEAGVAERRPVEPGGSGHGCGHNMLGSAALLAATAVKDWLQRSGTPGRVRYYGCPAEEGGSAKTYMVRASVFDDVDAAVTWHPGGTTRVDTLPYLANSTIDFHFVGRAAHASSSAHLGRSALDAVELMSVGVNYMREHMPSHARIHYAILDGGGPAANVVQARAAVRYVVRGRDNPEVAELSARVRKIAEAAAMMSETEVSWKVISGCSNLLSNEPLQKAMARHYQCLGPVPFDDADRVFAAEMQRTLDPKDIWTDYARVGMKVKPNTPLCDFIVPNEARGEPVMGSTDVGDVSWKVPTVQARVATHAIGTPAHTWQIVAQGKAGAAHKGLVYAAKVMAATAIDILTDADLRLAAKKDHLASTGGRYDCPIPDDIKPAIKPWPAECSSAAGGRPK